MKKMACITLAVLMVVSLGACGSDEPVKEEPQQETIETVAELPKTSEPSPAEDLKQEEAPEPVALAFFPAELPVSTFQNAEPMPKIAYTTPAEENGLAGTVCTVTGTVTQIIDGEFPYFVVSTESGDIAMERFDLAVRASADWDASFDAFYPIFSDPAVGDAGVFLGIYAGYAEAIDMPVLAYGTGDMMVEVLSATDDEAPQEPETTKDPEPVKEPEPVKGTKQHTSDSKPTTEQKNALATAKDYLRYTAFSRDGLIDQLEFEQFSHEDAAWAVDQLDADWNEQALACAKSYLDYTAFSYSGLIDQLEFEGFTHEQAVYAADRCGADWKVQAAKCAESYLNYASFSRAELIDQLIFEGFTNEQAVYGVTANGL